MVGGNRLHDRLSSPLDMIMKIFKSYHWNHRLNKNNYLCSKKRRVSTFKKHLKIISQFVINEWMNESIIQVFLERLTRC